MEDLPTKQLIKGRPYIFYGKMDECPHMFPCSPTMCGIFDGYYYNNVGYCMQKFHDVIFCESFEPFDVYNPSTPTIKLESDYSRVRIMDMRYHCIPARRFNETEKKQIEDRANLIARTRIERSLTGTITASPTYSVFLPRELIRLITDYLC